MSSGTVVSVVVTASNQEFNRQTSTARELYDWSQLIQLSPLKETGIYLIDFLLYYAHFHKRLCCLCSCCSSGGLSCSLTFSSYLTISCTLLLLRWICRREISIAQLCRARTQHTCRVHTYPKVID